RRRPGRDPEVEDLENEGAEGVRGDVGEGTAGAEQSLEDAGEDAGRERKERALAERGSCRPNTTLPLRIGSITEVRAILVPPWVRRARCPRQNRASWLPLRVTQKLIPSLQAPLGLVAAGKLPAAVRSAAFQRETEGPPKLVTRIRSPLKATEVGPF